MRFTGDTFNKFYTFIQRYKHIESKRNEKATSCKQQPQENWTK